MSMAEITIVSAREAHDLMQRGWYLVDLRSANDYAQYHVPDSFNIPFNRRAPAAWVREIKDTFATLDPVIVICQDGDISTDAFYHLFVNQFECIRDVSRGMNGWVRQSELPLTVVKAECGS